MDDCKIYAFERFRLDPRERRLLHAGRPIALAPKVLDTLIVLIQNAGSLVSKQELHRHLWPDTFVEDVTLARSISDLRTALGRYSESKYIETVPKHGYRFISDVHVTEGVSAPEMSGALDSIAILPFQNGGGHPEMEYLSDGIAEAVINNLAQLRPLRVVPRATAFRYKGSELTASEIGRKLGVRLVLTGQVVQRNNLLSITAELIEVLKDSQVWGERYNRKTIEILQVEREIGKEIAERLELKLSREDHNRLAKRKTESSDAHLLVLKAWHAGRRWSPDGLRKGLEYATQAIEADPSYADAHASLAYMYVYAGFASLSPHETFPRAKAAASRALDLDPHLSVAHAILAMTKIAYDRDWSGALEECRRAIELAPNLPAGHFACSHLHLAHGRFPEALEEARLASDLDPLSSPMAYQRAAVLYYAGQEEEAVAQLEKFEYLDPSFLPAHELLAVLYARANRPKEALEEAAQAVALSGSDLRGKAILAIVSATVGRESEARIILDGLELTSVPPDYKWSLSCALIHALLGQRDRVFYWLDKACQAGGGALNFVRSDPHFASLRDDPSFHQILSRMGLNN